MTDYHGNLKISDHFVRRYAERVLLMDFGESLGEFKALIRDGVAVTLILATCESRKKKRNSEGRRRAMENEDERMSF